MKIRLETVENKSKAIQISEPSVKGLIQIEKVSYKLMPIPFINRTRQQKLRITNCNGSQNNVFH